MVFNLICYPAEDSLVNSKFISYSSPKSGKILSQNQEKKQCAKHRKKDVTAPYDSPRQELKAAPRVTEGCVLVCKQVNDNLLEQMYSSLYLH